MKQHAPAPPGNVPKPKSQHALVMAFGLFFLVMATFWACGDNAFTNYDDPDYVTDNPHVQQGLTRQSIKWAFSNTRDTGNWHPITWLSHMLDYQLFGANPRGHHRSSVVLHSVNVVLLFLVLNRMTGQKWLSLAVAALFGLHPLRVESVAWISERKDVLSAFFFMLTIWAYARYSAFGVQYSLFRDKRAGGWYGLALVFFAFGLMSKPMVVTLPLVLLLLDYWPLGRVRRERLVTGNYGLLTLFVEKLPFFALAIADGVLTFLSQKGAGTMEAARHLPLEERIANGVVSYVRYLGKLFWPTNLSVHYPRSGPWPMGLAILAAALLIGVSMLALRARERHAYLLTGWFWYLAMLVPVIGVVQVGIQAMADRYTYLPSIGVLVMVVWGVNELLKEGKPLKRLKDLQDPAGTQPKQSVNKGLWNSARLRWTVLASATCGAALGYILVTQHQIGFWKDSGTLFQHAIGVTRNNNIALMHLANYERHEGRLAAAIELYRRALQIDPQMEEPQVNLGVILYVSGEQEPGIRQLQEALKVLPNSALLHGNLGFFLAQKGLLDEAASQLETVLKIDPTSSQAHVGLGDICAKKGDREGAIGQYREALKLRPGLALAERRLQALGAL